MLKEPLLQNGVSDTRFVDEYVRLKSVIGFFDQLGFSLTIQMVYGWRGLKFTR